jgi:hypothetical protein
MIEPRRSANTGVRAARPKAGRGDGAGEDRIAELEARLAKLERAPSLRARGRSLMDRVIPREASHHFRNAGREELLGIRAIVDFWIDRIDEAEGRAGSGARRESIEIE